MADDFPAEPPMPVSSIRYPLQAGPEIYSATLGWPQTRTPLQAYKNGILSQLWYYEVSCEPNASRRTLEKLLSEAVDARHVCSQSLNRSIQQVQALTHME